jgi:hypothetical protein
MASSREPAAALPSAGRRKPAGGVAQQISVQCFQGPSTEIMYQWLPDPVPSSRIDRFTTRQARRGYRPLLAVRHAGSGTGFRDGLTWAAAACGSGPANGRFRDLFPWLPPGLGSRSRLRGDRPDGTLLLVLAAYARRGCAVCWRWERL